MKIILSLFVLGSIFCLESFSTENDMVGYQPTIPQNQINEDTLIVGDLIFADFFSPNGDLHNDTYIILNAENYPDNVFKVFNRWGDIVYRASPYKNDWNGTCNVSGPLFNDQCSEGIYYFEFYNGFGIKATGKITLKR